MKCKKPFRRGLIEFGCGQCLSCRISKRRIWTTRIVLEWLVTGIGCFVTLTYNEANLPQDGNLSKRDLQLFLKKFRHYAGKFKYYAVGEYGEQTKRPHYHIIFFGIYVPAKIVQMAWGKGRVHVGELNQHTAQYTAGYIEKKLTSAGDRYLGGKKPEFSLMSRGGRKAGGIGLSAISKIVDALKDESLKAEMQLMGDIKSEINFGKRKMPLGRYLKVKIREVMGIENEENKEKRLHALSCEKKAELQDFMKRAKDSGESIEKMRAAERRQANLRLEKRNKIYSRREKL